MSDENERTPGLHAHLGKAQFTDGYLEFVEDGRSVYPDTMWLAQIYLKRDPFLTLGIGLLDTVKKACEDKAKELGVKELTEWHEFEIADSGEIVEYHASGYNDIELINCYARRIPVLK